MSAYRNARKNEGGVNFSPMKFARAERNLTPTLRTYDEGDQVH